MGIIKKIAEYIDIFGGNKFSDPTKCFLILNKEDFEDYQDVLYNDYKIEKRDDSPYRFRSYRIIKAYNENMDSHLIGNCSDCLEIWEKNRITFSSQYSSDIDITIAKSLFD